jgi:hypothetical protein
MIVRRGTIAFLLLLLLAAFASLSEARSKKNKLKKFFAKKKHHKKAAAAPATTSIATTSTSFAVSFIEPTTTIFGNNGFYEGQLSSVYITITDPNFNYFYGYATAAPVNGPNGMQQNGYFYNNNRMLVPGPVNCGCCDSKPIYVTYAPSGQF